MQEEWKKVKNHDGYSCSKSGKIRNDHTGKISNKAKDATGYLTISLTNNDGKTKHTGIHRLIADTWLENPENKATVNHKNKDRSDNCVENLEWATYTEQNIHKLNTQVKKFKNNIGIWKCDKDSGERINYYRTIKEAENDNSIKNGCGNIVICAKGKINYAYGYKWEYADDKLIDVTKDSFEGEEWKTIFNTYKISNHGRLINRKKLLVPSNVHGYYSHGIKGKPFRVNRLVAENFLPNPNNYNTVNHINGNKLDNKYTNLEWCTQTYNINHAIKNGLRKNVKKIIQYNDKYEIINIYDSCATAARELHITYTVISNTCKGKINANKVKLNFKFLEPTDDLINMKIDNTHLLIKQPKVRVHGEIRQVNVYDKNWKLLGTCDSRVDAARKYKVQRMTVTQHCNGLVKYPTSNYNFKYVN